MLKATLRLRHIVLAASLFAVLHALTPPIAPAAGAEIRSEEETRIALNLAKLLQSARSVVSARQALINDPSIGDKGLTGEVVLAEAIQSFGTSTGMDPTALDPDSRQGRMLKAEMEAIKEVVDESQSLINEKGIAFKGFIPAVFARRVTEKFQEKMGAEAEMKVTAPPALVRNRKARPDDWERQIIETKFMSSGWKRGEFHAEPMASKGRDAFRVMVPEYYAASCLSCHGQPKGAIDITGYPKEGAAEGDLGGVISISLFLKKE